MKRIIAFLLGIALLVLLVPAAYARTADHPKSFVYTETVVNPLYPEFANEAVPGVVTPIDAQYQPDASKKYVSMEEAIRQFKAALEKHQEVIHLYIDDPAYSPEVHLGNYVIDHTGVPTQGDYINWSYKFYKTNSKATYTSGRYIYDLELTVTYYHNAEQEQELTRKIDEVLRSLELDKYEDDYHKLNAIYDYLSSHITYELTYDKNDPYYKLQYSAYSALVDGKAVCQGIASLLYRMLLEIGFDNRLISGRVWTGPHGWNIVKVGDLYYNVDLSNDLGRDGSYRYFLRSVDFFTSHHRDPAFDTPEFHQLYPMSEDDYQPVHYFDGQPWVTHQQPDCERPGIEYQYCKYCSYYKSRYFASKLGHDLEYIGYWQATCERSGYRVYDCTRCNKLIYQEKQARQEHDFNITILEEPTWMSWGTWVEGYYGLINWYCIRCGYDLDETSTYTPHEHSYSELGRVEPTCTNRGYTVSVCEICNVRQHYDYVESLGGHKWSEEDSLGDVYCKKCFERKGMPFNDVKPKSFYCTPVSWAIENNITTGISAVHFGPNDTCQRAQVVTFLWRAAGQPEPTGVANPFTDVKETDYYYKAVLWAVENGITNGITDDTFGPFMGCNRAQVVTFLHRAMGEVQPTESSHPFTDVKDSEFYYTAMLWAVENGITNGLSATTFGPNSICNRAQIVTFLYRAYQ